MICFEMGLPATSVRSGWESCAETSRWWSSPPQSARVRLGQEIHDFLTWFNHPPAGMDELIRLGIAHFWFVTIHPFEDGNGRLARTIGDLALAQADRSHLRFYSVSGQIMRNKGTYYDALEGAQHGGLDITDFLAWFLDEFRFRP